MLFTSDYCIKLLNYCIDHSKGLQDDESSHYVHSVGSYIIDPWNVVAKEGIKNANMQRLFHCYCGYQKGNRSDEYSPDSVDELFTHWRQKLGSVTYFEDVKDANIDCPVCLEPINMSHHVMLCQTCGCVSHVRCITSQLDVTAIQTKRCTVCRSEGPKGLLGYQISRNPKEQGCNCFACSR